MGMGGEGGGASFKSFISSTVYHSGQNWQTPSDEVQILKDCRSSLKRRIKKYHPYLNQKGEGNEYLMMTLPTLHVAFRMPFPMLILFPILRITGTVEILPEALFDILSDSLSQTYSGIYL